MSSEGRPTLQRRPARHLLVQLRGADLGGPHLRVGVGELLVDGGELAQRRLTRQPHPLHLVARHRLPVDGRLRPAGLRLCHRQLRLWTDRRAPRTASRSGQLQLSAVTDSRITKMKNGKMKKDGKQI